MNKKYICILSLPRITCVIDNVSIVYAKDEDDAKHQCMESYLELFDSRYLQVRCIDDMDIPFHYFEG
jgi:hypothetical protein